MPTLDEQLKQLETPAEKTPQFNVAMEPFASINVGLAHMFGLPGTAANLLRSAFGYEKESVLPTGREVQQMMADLGMTYGPGEEPETLGARMFENLGASLPVMGGMAATGIRTAIPYATELVGAAGGAVGGKALEATTWGEEHPDMARAVGELTGGLGAAGALAGTASALRTARKISPLSWIRAPYRGAWARRRAVRRLSEVVADPEKALRELQEGVPVEDLTAAQRTGEEGIARLRRVIEEEIPEELHRGVIQRSEITKKLKKAAIGPEDISDTRRYIEQMFDRYASDAQEALRKIETGADPSVHSRKAIEKIDTALKESRELESRIWNALPEGEPLVPSSLLDAYGEELRSITEGGDISEIDSFIRKKLGKLNKKGKLIGGELIHAKKPIATPKALHQFYSRLGRRMRELSVQAGQTNKIRILRRLRKKVLDDLDTTVEGENYRAAIDFSKDLNEKFTSGSLGKVLGFQRGQASDEALALDDLLGAGGQQARQNFDQVLRATPEARGEIENFLKSRFAMMSVGKNNAINRNAAEKFIQKYNRLLDAFPDLKRNLQDAARKQANVDDLVGVPDISGMSPLAKEKAAASFFIGSDPGDEIRNLLRQGRTRGKTTEYLNDLLKQVRKDPTGKAQAGLKNAAISEILENSKRSLEDPLTGNQFYSGKQFLDRLASMGKSFLDSGLFSREEVNRLKKIGKALKRVETELAPVGKEPKITTDMPGQGLDLLARLTGARLGGQLGAQSAGGSLQWAQIMSSKFKQVAQAITKDEARDLLIRATRDDALMKDLLADVNKLSKKQQTSLVNRIISRAKEMTGTKQFREPRQPVTGVAPAMVSVGRESERKSEDIELQDLIDSL